MMWLTKVIHQVSAMLNAVTYKFRCISCGRMLYMYYSRAPLLYVLLVTCMNNTHIPGVDTAIDEDNGVWVTMDDAVVVKPGGKHPASSISEQQSPKL